MAQFQYPFVPQGPVKSTGQAQSAFTGQDLGAFEPPADYAFEPEFEPPVPRPIPKRARQGRMEQRRAWALRGGLAFGIVCVAIGELPLIKHWGQFVLPLAYLSWIGVGVIGLGALSIVVARLGVGPYRYIVHGIPLVARVVELFKSPVIVHNGQATFYALWALVEYRDPRTGDLMRKQVKSPGFIAGAKDHYTTSFKVGDYVTAVYLPGSGVSSLQLFGFLDLIPELGLVCGLPIFAKRDLWKIPLLLVAIAALFAVLVWNVYAFRNYHPIDFDYRNAMWPMLVGGATFAAWSLGRTWRRHRREQRRVAERNAAALSCGEAVELGAASIWEQRGLYGLSMKVMLIFGSVGIGATTALCWCFTANAWLDNSPSVLKLAEVTELTVETRGHMVREYLIEYLLPGVRRPAQFATTPVELARFTGNTAIAEVHAGRFGWPWVKTLRPIAMK